MVGALLLVSSFSLAGCFSTQVDDELNFPKQIDELKNATPQQGADEESSIEGDISMTKQNKKTDNGQVEPVVNTNEQPSQDLPQEINEFQRLEQQAGTGVPAKAGNKITVHYTGMLTNGQVFDSSLNRGQPFSFQLGSGQVIQGWDQGLIGAQKGGKYRLLIPSAMGYGERGAGQSIPPNADLIFDVEVIDIN